MEWKCNQRSRRRDGDEARRTETSPPRSGFEDEGDGHVAVRVEGAHHYFYLEKNFKDTSSHRRGEDLGEGEILFHGFRALVGLNTRAGTPQAAPIVTIPAR